MLPVSMPRLLSRYSTSPLRSECFAFCGSLQQPQFPLRLFGLRAAEQEKKFELHPVDINTAAALVTCSQASPLLFFIAKLGNIVSQRYVMGCRWTTGCGRGTSRT